jgi:hypothetical protein
MIKTTPCQVCTDKSSYVRSRCLTCNHGYCSQCRPPKNLTNQKCPYGHPFLIRDYALTEVICDVCTKKIMTIGGGFCYNEPICDFAVCINCFEKLPRENNFFPKYEKESLDINYLERR